MTTKEKETSTGMIDIARQPISRWMRPNVPATTTEGLQNVLSTIAPPMPSKDVLRLSPSRPRVDESHLTLYAPLLVESDPEQEYALFSSEYPDVVFPGLSVEFAPIKPGKAHLVEFHVELFGGATYKFRKFTYPLFDYEDMSDDKTSVISILVPAAPSWSSSYGAQLQQRNEPGDQAGWLLKYVRITAVD